MQIGPAKGQLHQLKPQSSPPAFNSVLFSQFFCLRWSPLPLMTLLHLQHALWGIALALSACGPRLAHKPCPRFASSARALFGVHLQGMSGSYLIYTQLPPTSIRLSHQSWV
mmetsp:Transcript_32643/g.74885  ORF Transcript_32643/g.74885 Transcript_32643/m.74885 type:complete len:111 (-) Transcript_32643:289-621(-)